MYVITFYSFKGGVGRTMALLNVACELVRRGRKVLLVDFDLEAPGIDTYKLPKPEGYTPGLVDYVTEYLRNGVAPSFSNFFYECRSVAEGTLWVMPSGKQQDSTYAADLAAIDWQDLYANRDGYLLFENLKQDWRNTISPDYVLIDSRTGHTDVTGICTRQLPDAVAIFFHPDEQNRRGLTTIVRQVRSEASSPRQKDIRLYFVMSNVPDLDDEDQILARSMRQSKESLGYAQLAGVIHRYNSLALLNQIIFTLERPKSRLAAEYRGLVDTFVRDNLADREAALALLANISDPVRIQREVKASDLESKLSKIQTAHSDDGEVLLNLAQFRRRQRRTDEALALLDKAEQAGGTAVKVCLARADLFQQIGDQDRSVEYANKVLDFDSVDYVDLTGAVNILRRKAALQGLACSAAVRSLDSADSVQLVQHLHSSRMELRVSEQILSHVLRNADPSREVIHEIQAELVLVLIGLGEFERAVEIGSRAVQSDGERLRNAFNLAMAQWGARGAAENSFFERFLQLAAQDTKKQPHTPNPNYLQCIALAQAVSGNAREALMHIEEARKAIRSFPQPQFSAWVYLEVPVDDFLVHLNEQERMTRSQVLHPPVIYLQERDLFAN